MRALPVSKVSSISILQGKSVTVYLLYRLNNPPLVTGNRALKLYQSVYDPTKNLVLWFLWPNTQMLDLCWVTNYKIKHILPLDLYCMFIYGSSNISSRQVTYKSCFFSSLCLVILEITFYEVEMIAFLPPVSWNAIITWCMISVHPQVHMLDPRKWCNCPLCLRLLEVMSKW